MAPARPHRAGGDIGPAIIIAGHLQWVLANRTRHHNVVDLSIGTVTQHVISGSSRDHPFESAGYSDGIVIVVSEQSQADRCYEQNEEGFFHLAEDKRADGSLSVRANP